MKRHAALTSTFTNVLGRHAKLNRLFRSLSANLPEANKARRLRVARLVALFSITGLAILFPSSAESVNTHAFGSSKELVKYVAQKQLTDKQYQCHNQIIYLESRWNEKAIGNKSGKKQAYGLYQLKIASLKNAHPEIQFWKYWEYVSHRYGITEYDEPMYCAALSHLKNKGWQ